jgi:hypothetical protein
MLQRLSCLPLHSLAKSSGFVLRRPIKLSLQAFLQSLLLALHQPSHSFQSWAAQLSALQEQLFSKQALHRRCGPQLVKFLELLLASVLGSFTRPDCPALLFQHFRRVLLQDSTALALDPSLAKHFPACSEPTPKQISQYQGPGHLRTLFPEMDPFPVGLPHRQRSEGFPFDSKPPPAGRPGHP